MDTLLNMSQLRPRQLPVSAVLAKRKAELVRLLPDFANAERSGIFAENFFPDQPVEFRRKAVQALYAKAGPIRRVGELIPENQLRGHFLLEGEKASIDVFFTLTPEQNPLIQQLDFREIPNPCPVTTLPLCYVIWLSFCSHAAPFRRKKLRKHSPKWALRSLRLRSPWPTT